MEDRIPPQNVEAEQSVLGAMLISREAIEKACEILREDDFYRQDDRIVLAPSRTSMNAMRRLTSLRSLRNSAKGQA